MTGLTIKVVLFVMVLCSNQKFSVMCAKRVFGETLLVPLRNTREANCECGKLTRKIDDERLAKVKIPGGRVPWLVELVTIFENNGNEPDEFRLCFGALVSLQTAIIPASCIDSNAIKKPKVKLLWINNKKDTVEISSVLVHPNYRGKYDNDIAIIKLKHVIDFNATKIVPICLPKPGKMYPVKYPQIPEATANMTGFEKLSMHDNTGFANSNEDDWTRVRPCRNPYPPCAKRPCPPCPSTTTTTRRPPTNKIIKPPPPPPPQYVLASSVTRTWFYRKSPGYDYIQFYGRFDVANINATNCTLLFPEMLKSKVVCIWQKEIRDIMKQNDKFFTKLELGMPLMLSNTTLVKGKPQAPTTKYYLEGIRAPGSRGGIPLLDFRQNAIPLLKIEDYVPWIRQNSHNGHFCKM